MSEANEQRQSAYLELVQVLLQCPQGEEDRILATHPELLDEGLVMKLLAVAKMLGDRQDPDADSTIEWLINFAGQLAQKLGLDTGEDTEMNDDEDAEFLLGLLQAIANSEGDRPIVHLYVDNQRQYGEILLSLLECTQNDTERVLTKYPEFIDGGLVIMIITTALKIMRMEDPETSSTIERLISFSAQLTQELGLDITIINEVHKAYYQSLFQALFAIVAASGENEHLAYQFLDNHIPSLNKTFLSLFPSFFEELICQAKDIDALLYIALKFNNLGVYLAGFTKGNLAINLELSIVAGDLALSIFAKLDKPINWAMTQSNRARHYCRRIEGNRELNLREGIAGLNRALTIYTKEDFPVEWAIAQMSLAIAYRDLIHDDSQINLEVAIEYFSAALEIFTKAEHPYDWAKNNLLQSELYIYPIKRNRQDYLEVGIKGFDSALEIFTQDKFPFDWARTQMNRAIAYKAQLRGDHQINFKNAIDGFINTLKVYTRDEFSFEWATTKSNLGATYIDLINGDRQLNIRLAIECLNDALEVFTQDEFPTNWAKTQMNLAIAYEYKIEFEMAIKCYNTALKVFNLDLYPVEWARTQMNLAIAYLSKSKGELNKNILKSNLEMAIECCDAALEVFTQDKFSIQWAKVKTNRAWACTIYDLYNMTESSSQYNVVEAGLIDYNAALQVFTRDKSPFEWAGIQMSISALHLIEGNYVLAIDLLLKAIEIFTPESNPINALKANDALGDIYLRQEEWQLATKAYETAMQAVETSRSWVVNEENRQQLLKDAISIYENAIQCAINLGNYAQAIQYTERIRSRQLVDLMGTKYLYPDAEIPADIQKYLDEYEQLNRQIHHLREHRSPDGDGTTKSTRNAASLSRDNTTILALEAQKRAQYLKIRAFDPAIAGQIAVEPIDFAAIQKLITTPHTAILTCYTTDNDTHIFIIKQGQQPTLHTCTNQGLNGLQQWLQTEWIIAYHQPDNSIWQQNLPTLLTEISQRLQLDALIKEHLTDITELIIVPHLNLHQIPFAALPINPTQNKASGSFLGDKFIIRSIPSCQILQYCQQRKPITTKHIGTVEDAEDNLLGARYEGEQIAALYSIPTANRLRGSAQATVANYRELLTRVNRLHSSHHAISRPDNPIESALILANGERITLGDLLLGKRYRDTLDEVFLSACETHVGTATLTDDVATLTTGFLCIGARSVQSTLWSVDDLVTALFDIFYHQERRDDVNRALSLQAAQVRLRNLTGEEFKISHYPKLKAFIDGYRKPTLDRLEARMDELDLAKKTANQEEQIKINEEYDQLDRLYIKIGEAPNILEKYCQQQQPFESPYYWGAFTCQGMA
jgi:CHAT domain-containing protein